MQKIYESPPVPLAGKIFVAILILIPGILLVIAAHNTKAKIISAIITIVMLIIGLTLTTLKDVIKIKDNYLIYEYKYLNFTTKTFTIDIKDIKQINHVLKIGYKYSSKNLYIIQTKDLKEYSIYDNVFENNKNIFTQLKKINPDIKINTKLIDYDKYKNR